MKPHLHQHLGNFAALSAIQLANALLPVLVFPWLLTVVGPVPFARIAVTEALALLVLAVVLFSFEVDGVAKVSGLSLATDRRRIAGLASAILYLRLLLLGACVALACAAALLVDHAGIGLLLCWLLLPLGYILQSAWLFQGLENNVPLAVCVVASRLLCLAALYLFITGPEAYRLAPLIIGACYALGGLCALLYLVLALGLRPQRVPLRELRALLVGGKEIFLGNLSVTLFRDANVLILGALGSATAVAAYSVAEKLVKCFQALARPLNQLLFPRVIRAIAGMRAPDQAAFRIILRYTLPQLLALTAAALAAALGYAGLRAYFPAGAAALEADIVALMPIMAPAVLFGVANFMFGSAGLNYLNRRAYFARAIFLTGVCSVVMCMALGFFMAQRGAALAFLFSEFFLFVLIARAFRRAG